MLLFLRPKNEISSILKIICDVRLFQPVYLHHVGVVHHFRLTESCLGANKIIRGSINREKRDLTFFTNFAY